jgi:pyruvate ferredoxin oxidoreductase alpha subunit
MLRLLEGSRAVAEAVAACRPNVVCAYPISPQTHIVEALAVMARTGDLPRCEYINVESEFAAMSVAIGASAAGGRAYTATASQGLLFMSEAVFNAGGLGLPVVMTVANRAIGAPINIWNDHSDSMSQRDAGWVQLYASDNQRATDLHVLAFRLAEELSVPVMVCMDGFVLTHAMEPVDVPDRTVVDDFLPPFRPRQQVDPDRPATIGAMVGPEAFTEVKALQHATLQRASERLPALAEELGSRLGRAVDGLMTPYRLDDADTAVVTLGSTLGTLQDVVDERRAAGERLGALGLVAFRPFPLEALAKALAPVRRVVVLERAFSPGAGGIVTADLRPALAPGVRCDTVVAGLGGRAVTRASLHGLLDDVAVDRLGPLTFLDLDDAVLENQAAMTGSEK